MRRGAIIPGGWTAIVVADEIEGSSALRPILVESFEVGTNVPLEGGKMIRDISEADIERLIARTVQRFVDMRVDSVTIEWATSKTAKAHAVAVALNFACAERGLPSTYTKRWRMWNAFDHRSWVRRRILEGYAGWPEGTFEVARNCGAMLLESIASGRPQQLPPPSPPEVTHDPSRDESAAVPHAPGESTPVVDVDAKLEPSGALPTPDGSFRVAGIDPGSGYLALVIGEGDAKPIKLVYAHTFPVGERVPLKRPRKITRGGETIILTTRHSLTIPMAEGLAAKVVAVMVKHRVAKLALEHVESVHIGTDAAAAASSIATALIRTSWIDTLIGSGAKAAGIEVVRVNVATWRAKVAGRARGKRGGAGAELIPDAVRGGFENWPADADPHIFDAGGACLWLALPAPVVVLAEKVKRTRKTAAPRPEGVRPPSYHARMERLRKETAERRKASGCTCSNRRRGRHRSGCPLGHPNAPKEKEA